MSDNSMDYKCECPGEEVKVRELSQEELEQVTGGTVAPASSSITDSEAKAVGKMAGGIQTVYDEWLNNKNP